MKKCRDCKFWQGSRFSTWGDCYRVVASIKPELLEIEEEGRRFTTPFDPHDVQYWKHNANFNKLYAEALAEIPQPGIRKEKKFGCWYIQTHKDYECEEV